MNRSPFPIVAALPIERGRRAQAIIWLRLHRIDCWMTSRLIVFAQASDRSDFGDFMGARS